MPLSLVSERPQASDLPPQITPNELGRRGLEETARFRRGAPHDDRYCLELFRRAVTQRDDACWGQLLAIYHEQVSIWCRPSGAFRGDDLDELVALAWEKFWYSYTPVKLEAAHNLAAVLRYLKMCARSVSLDAARERSATVPLNDTATRRPDDAPSPLDLQIAGAARGELWQVVRQHLRTEQEQTLVYLMYELELRSREIQARRPDLFPTVVDVYRTTRNVLNRLRRSHDLHAWLDQQCPLRPSCRARQSTRPSPASGRRDR